jgi:DNA mismatch repair protein MutS
LRGRWPNIWRRTPRRPKTLFATHYHELTDLADALPGVINAHVAAREWQEDIVFLHKIVPGRATAATEFRCALAGMPASVITRARAILQALEHDEIARAGGRRSAAPRQSRSGSWASFRRRVVPPIDEKAEKLTAASSLDTDTITPLQALTILTN